MISKASTKNFKGLFFFKESGFSKKFMFEYLPSDWQEEPETDKLAFDNK